MHRSILQNSLIDFSVYYIWFSSTNRRNWKSQWGFESKYCLIYNVLLYYLPEKLAKRHIACASTSSMSTSMSIAFQPGHHTRRRTKCFLKEFNTDLLVWFLDSDSCHMKRDDHLELWTLEERRNRADLWEVFKIYKGLKESPCCPFISSFATAQLSQPVAIHQRLPKLGAI